MLINKIHTDTVKLAFLKSTNIQAFPCGRRRSELVDKDGSVATTNDQYYFPFDPEARLNTEANHRKQSGLNGYTQTYLKEWDKDNKLLTLSLAGYLFTIDINVQIPEVKDAQDKVIEQAYNLVNEADFGAKMATLVGAENAIYANIVLEDVHLFSGFREYHTRVLRDQLGRDSESPSTQLDLLTDADSIDVKSVDVNDFNNYYFSGLSFSSAPMAGIGQSGYTPTTRDICIKTEVGNRKATQEIVSLCILEKVKTSADGVTPEVWEWKIHEPARLPFIEHDTLEDSVVMGETHVRKNLTVDENATINQNFTVKDKVEVTSNSTKVKNKLVVENDVEVENNTITTKNLTATETVLAKNIGTDDNKIVKITATEAKIDTLNANDIQQNIAGLDSIPAKHYDVPVMFIKQVDGEYQLQISRVNKLN